MADDQPDLFSAKAAKREALDRVLANAGKWSTRCLIAIADLAATRPGAIVTGEDLRLLLTRQIGAPHHHNAWGAAISVAGKRGYLVPIDKTVPMRTVKSHARKTPQYRLVG